MAVIGMGDIRTGVQTKLKNAEPEAKIKASAPVAKNVSVDTEIKAGSKGAVPYVGISGRKRFGKLDTNLSAGGKFDMKKNAFTPEVQGSVGYGPASFKVQQFGNKLQDTKMALKLTRDLGGGFSGSAEGEGYLGKRGLKGYGANFLLGKTF
jgi:hypothetical protein